jgi:hypothetical protein
MRVETRYRKGDKIGGRYLVHPGAGPSLFVEAGVAILSAGAGPENPQNRVVVGFDNRRVVEVQNQLGGKRGTNTP